MSFAFKREWGNPTPSANNHKRFLRSLDCKGSGASKTVYVAYDTQTGREVAWADVPMDNKSLSQKKNILREIEIMKKLKHPSLTTLIDAWFDTANKKVVMISPLGTPLRKFCRFWNVALNLNTVRRWCIQILNGLHYLHNCKPPIVHRDMKIENLLLDSSGDIKIVDYGVARYIDTKRKKQKDNLTRFVGTPTFMAPEMYETDTSYDYKVDIYAFGMVMLEICTGKNPYSNCGGDPHKILVKLIQEIMPLEITRVRHKEIRDIVRHCLSKDPKKRPSALELLQNDFFTRKLSAEEKQSNPAFDDLELAIDYVHENRGAVPAAAAQRVSEPATEKLKKKVTKQAEALIVSFDKQLQTLKANILKALQDIVVEDEGEDEGVPEDAEDLQSRYPAAKHYATMLLSAETATQHLTKNLDLVIGGMQVDLVNRVSSAVLRAEGDNLIELCGLSALPGGTSPGIRHDNTETDLESISEGINLENDQFDSALQTVFEAEPPTIEPQEDTTEDNASAAASINSVGSPEATEKATAQTYMGEAAKPNAIAAKSTNSKEVDPFEELKLEEMAFLKKTATTPNAIAQSKSLQAKPRSNSVAGTRNKSHAVKPLPHSSSADSLLIKPNGDKKANANAWSAAKKSEHQHTTQYKMVASGNKRVILGPGSTKPISNGPKKTKEQLTTQYKISNAGDKIVVGSATPKGTATKLAEEQKAAQKNAPLKVSNGAGNGMESTQNKRVARFKSFDNLMYAQVASVKNNPATATQTQHVFDPSRKTVGPGNRVNGDKGIVSGPGSINTAAKTTEEHRTTQYKISGAGDKIDVLGTGSAKSARSATKSAEEQKMAQNNARAKGADRAANTAKPNQKKPVDPFDDLTLEKVASVQSNATVPQKHKAILKPAPIAVDSGTRTNGNKNVASGGSRSPKSAAISAQANIEQRTPQTNAHVSGVSRAGNGMKPAQNNTVDPFDDLDLEGVGSVDKNSNTTDAPTPLSRAQSSTPMGDGCNNSDPFGEIDRMLSSSSAPRRNTASGIPSTPEPAAVRRTVSCEDPFRGLGLTPDKNGWQESNLSNSDMAGNNSKPETGVTAVDPDPGVPQESDPFSVIDSRNSDQSITSAAESDPESDPFSVIDGGIRSSSAASLTAAIPSKPVGVELDAGLAAHPGDATGANVKPEVAIAEGSDPFSIIDGVVSVPEKIVMAGVTGDNRTITRAMSLITGASLQQLQDFNASARPSTETFPAEAAVPEGLLLP